MKHVVKTDILTGHKKKGNLHFILKIIFQCIFIGKPCIFLKRLQFIVIVQHIALRNFIKIFISETMKLIRETIFKAKIYGVKQLVIGQRQKAPKFSACHWSPHGSLVSIGHYFVTTRVVHLPKKTETSLITESDRSGLNHRIGPGCAAVHSCNSWFLSRFYTINQCLIVCLDRVGAVDLIFLENNFSELIIIHSNNFIFFLLFYFYFFIYLFFYFFFAITNI